MSHVLWLHLWASWAHCHRTGTLIQILRYDFPGHSCGWYRHFARWCLSQYGTGRTLYWALRPW